MFVKFDGLISFLPSPSDFAFLAGGVSFLFSAFLFPGVTGASVETVFF